MRKGLIEVVGGILSGIIVSTLLTAFKEDGIIPDYMFWIFTLAGFVSTLILLLSYTTMGILYMVGWIIGALILMDILGTADFIIYIIAPIIALTIRGILHFKGG